MLVNPYASLSDDQVRLNLDALAKRENEAGVEIILHLMLVKARRLHIPMGYDGLFAYCTGRLGFAKSTAFRRKVVVDTAEKFPEILDAMKAGLHLCVAAAVAPFLTEENAGELIREVRGLPLRDVELMLKRRSAVLPASSPPPIPESPAQTPASPDGSSAGTFSHPNILPRDPEDGEKPISDSQPHAPLFRRPPLPRTIVRALTADASRVNFSLRDTTVGKLRRAKEIKPHKSDDELLDCALDLFLERYDPIRRHARREILEARRQGSVVALSDHAETSRRGGAADRDAAYVESEGRCAFVSADGVRCAAKGFLEVDHVKPWALGGKSTKDNFRMLCSTHNKWLGEQTFGPRPSRG